MIFAHEQGSQVEAWRRSFLPSPETFHIQKAPLRPLLIKELWEILSGRALWTMLSLMCPLIGYSFFQAISLYGEASAAGLQSPVLASSLSPFSTYAWRLLCRHHPPISICCNSGARSGKRIGRASSSDSIALSTAYIDCG